MVTFPTTLDSLTNPTATDNLDTVGVVHHVQHADENDAIEALEAKVGVDGSTVTTSLDYKVAHRALTTTTITINWTTYDLSANRSWTVTAAADPNSLAILYQNM